MWKCVNEDSIEMYLDGIMDGFEHEKCLENYSGKFCCDDESVIELFCPEGEALHFPNLR